MLDTGNFIVSNQDNESVWETFDYPTDTILPTQTLNQGTGLVSRYTKQNYSMGKFRLSMQVDGNLVLYLQGLSADNEYGSYWSSTDTVGSGYQVGFDRSDEILLTARNGTVLRSIVPKLASSGGLYLRAVLDFDGVFRTYAYPSNGRPGANWTLQSSPIPTDICDTVIDLGGGICGVNSYCVIDPQTHTPKCNCLEQYTLIDPESDMSGCKPTFEPQTCNSDMSEANEFAFTEIPNTNWQNSDYDRLPLNETQCRESCLSDCFCYLVIMNDIPQCWKKKMPFSNGRTFLGAGGTRSLFKIRKDNSRSTPTPTRQEPGMNKKKDDNTVIIIVSVLLGTSGVINLLFLCLRRQGTRKDNIFPSPTAIVSEAASIRTFTYEELKEATDGFKEELGKGAFGAVYRGEIGKISIAVKVLNRLTVEGEKEFKAEVNTISRTNHKNLVQLIGFCSEGENRLFLVYEFMENGSLANYLFGIPKPSWFKRIEIACGIGRGLLYMHEEGSKQIIHCDIKPQNILLDTTFVAKILDFGLAKLLMTDQTGTVTAIRGTRGYLAPEWFRNKPVSVKVDVYGFGILLLELICCRKNRELNSDEENQMILSDWVFDCYRERMLHLLVEDDEEARSDMGTVHRFIKTAMWCIQEDPSLRPSMKIIMHMLEGAVEVFAPPDTSSFTSSI